MNKTIAITGILLILCGIILGAFGAHALKDLVSTSKLASFETGVRYQLLQGMGLLIIGLQSSLSFSLKIFYRLMLVGTLLFSFSIYLLTFSEVTNIPTKLIGPITPIGGLLMICAWLHLVFKMIRSTT
ncbi:MAG: DUF423 domain-containing protein [Crocinitomicaceae bacterium]